MHLLPPQAKGDVESGSDSGAEAAAATADDVPAVGAGHEERTPQMFKDMRKSRVFGALTKSANYGEASCCALCRLQFAFRVAAASQAISFLYSVAPP